MSLNEEVKQDVKNWTIGGGQLIADLVSRLGSPAPKASVPVWIYHTTRGSAVLNRGDDRPLTKIGQFTTEQLAREACERHFKKACRGLQSLNRPLPIMHFA